MDSIIAFLIAGFFGCLFGLLLRKWWPVGILVALCVAPILCRILATPPEWFSLVAAVLYGMVAGGFKKELLPLVVNSFYWLRNRWEVRAWERRQGHSDQGHSERAGSAGGPEDDPRPERRRYEPPPESEPRRDAEPGFWKSWGMQMLESSVRGSLWRRRTLRDEVRDARREASRLREELELQRRERAVERSRSDASVAEEVERLRRERQAVEEERRRQAQAAPGPRDPYAVLGVKRTATLEQIRRVYRTLAKAYHEDVAAGVAVDGRMAQLNQAMEDIERSRGK